MNTIKHKLFFLLTVRTRHHRGGGEGGGGESLRTIVKRSEESEEREVREVRDSLPEIITPSQVIRREVGGTAILACSVENLGQYVVMWKQQGRVISGQTSLLSASRHPPPPPPPPPPSPPPPPPITDNFSWELAGQERRPDETVRQ